MSEGEKENKGFDTNQVSSERPGNDAQEPVDTTLPEKEVSAVESLSDDEQKSEAGVTEDVVESSEISESFVQGPLEVSTTQDVEMLSVEEVVTDEPSVSKPPLEDAAQTTSSEVGVGLDSAVAFEQGSVVTTESQEPQQSVEHSAEKSEQVEQESPPAVEITEDHKWYVVHTYSGYEQKAKIALQERIKQNRLEKAFAEILIPSENVIELVRGQKKTTTRKFFPGYMLVRMILNETTWHLIKNTPRITGFVGNAVNPPSVPPEEVARITNQMEQGTLKPRPKVEFEEGESVRVIDGPFVNFNGVVEEVKPDKGKLRVMVSIFGRSTPVELDFVQVEKN